MVKKNFSKFGSDAAAAFFSEPDAQVLTEEKLSNNTENKQSAVKIEMDLKENITSYEKIERKTFSFKKSDLDNVTKMIEKFLELRKSVCQSEIIRMGISLIMELDDTELLNRLEKLERINSGRKPIHKCS